MKDKLISLKKAKAYFKKNGYDMDEIERLLPIEIQILAKDQIEREKDAIQERT